MGPTFHRDASASGTAVAFLVAGVIFIATIATVLVVTQEPPASDSVDGANQHAQAKSLADVLVDSQGVGWEAGADSVSRLGLAGTAGYLDNDHLEALRGAVLAADPTNGKVDYEEAKDSLGLGDDEEFHIRIRPVSIGAQGTLGLGHLKVAYIGDWDGLSDPLILLDTDEAMIAAVQASLDSQMGSLTGNERSILVSLGLDFIDDVYVGDEPEPLVDLGLLGTLPLLNQLGVSEIDGDVYPDQKKYIDAVFPQRLPDYDILIVGSQVDQSTLTSSATKNAIRDWVMGGGTLMVMGSDAANFQWLQPLFSVGTTTVNGGAFAPDPLHPILNDPHELQWPFYDNHGLGWDLKDQGSNANVDDFEHVVSEDEEDILTFSKTGAFGEGQVLLTTWRPKEVFETLSEDEASGFLENLIVYFDREKLRLEYGPQIPDGVRVSAAVREAIIEDPRLGPVPVRVELHLWSPVA